MNTFTLNLDLDKRFENDYVRIRQGDQNGTTIVANIYDHGTALDGTGLTARIRMRLPDGEHFYEKDATLSGNMATVTIDETQAASVSGTTDNAYFQILSGSTVIASTQDFTVRVLRDATSDAEVGENYSTQIQQAIDSLNDMTATIPEKVVDEVDAQLAAHPEWTTTVEDNSLTDAKLVQKGGILQREQWLETMLPNIPRKATSEADVHSVTDSAGGGPLGIEVYGRSTQDGTPTPDAPVAIESVQGNLYQQTAFAAGATHSTVGISIVHNADGTCTCSGTATASAWLWGGGDSADERLYVTLPAGTYTACGSHYVAGQKMVDGTVSTLFNTTQGSHTFTLTEETQVKIVAVVANGATVDHDTVWAALYEGSETHPYTPYGSVGLCSEGRNLLPNYAASVTKDGIEFTVNSDGSVGMNGTSTGTTRLYLLTAAQLVLRRALASLLRSGMTFTLSTGTTMPSGLVLEIAYYKGSTYQGRVTAVGLNADHITFTAPSDIDFDDINIYFQFTRSGVEINNLTFYPQIEVGPTANPYKPYESATIPINLGGCSLRSLPDGTRDELMIDEYGHAILTQRVGEVELSADWSWGLSSGGGYRVYTTEMKNNQNFAWSDDNRVLNAYSNRFGMKLNGQTYRGQVGISADAASAVQVCPTGQPTSVAEFKTWLRANPTTLLYPLATTVTIDLGHLDPALLPAPDLTAYVVPSAPSVLRYGYTVAESTSSNLAPVETSPATASHAAGTLLTLDGQLVKVTSAIAVGEAVTIGGNVRTTTIAAELAALA